jgi:hypothetical protein
LKELLDTKQIVPIDKDATSILNKSSTICYHDENNYYFIPHSTYLKVSEFFTRRGDLLNVSESMLRKMLVNHKYVVGSSDGDGHLTRKIKIGITATRVLQIPKAVMNAF